MRYYFLAKSPVQRGRQAPNKTKPRRVEAVSIQLKSQCPTDERKNFNKIRIEITRSINPFLKNDFFVSLKCRSSFRTDQEIKYLGACLLTKLGKDNYLDYK